MAWAKWPYEDPLKPTLSLFGEVTHYHATKALVQAQRRPFHVLLTSALASLYAHKPTRAVISFTAQLGEESLVAKGERRNGTDLFINRAPPVAALHPTTDFPRDVLDKPIPAGSLASLNGLSNLLPLTFRDGSPDPGSILFASLMWCRPQAEIPLIQIDGRLGSPASSTPIS